MAVAIHELIKKGTISSKDATIAGSVAAGFIVFLILYVALVDTAMKRHRDELGQRVGVKMSELEAAERLAEREEELADEFARIAELVEKFGAKLPTRKQLPRLYREFQVAAGEAGVRVRAIKKQNEVQGQTLVTIPYSFSVSGTYHQLATFMNMLECGDRFMKISELHIGEQENGISKADFKLSTYLFREEGL